MTTQLILVSICIALALGFMVRKVVITLGKRHSGCSHCSKAPYAAFGNIDRLTELKPR